jgi:hypothetical protein
VAEENQDAYNVMVRAHSGRGVGLVVHKIEVVLVECSKLLEGMEFVEKSLFVTDIGAVGVEAS